MRRALAELVLSGVATNQAFHLRLLEDDAFLRADIDSQFLERRPDLFEPVADATRLTALAIAAALAEEEARLSRRPAVADAASAGTHWVRAAKMEGLR